ncbi:MAG: hypothetical protein ACREO3_06485 [Arenimonas sp.]
MGGAGVNCVWKIGALAATLALGGCGWPGLVAGALTTPTSGDDASTNVAIAGGMAYVARSARGIERIDLASGKRSVIAPPAPADRIDDVAVADGLLFALDATPPGNLVVFKLEGNGDLRQVALAPAPVGPFSGVAAGGGHVIVSGGTSELTLRTYAVDGALSQPVADDFGRGQPDVVLTDGGRVTLISTHLSGPRFGLTVADITDAPLQLHERGYVELPGAGFTDGGFHPANFPLQVAALGDVALVAHGGGLSVVATPAGKPPMLLGTIALALHATAIAVDAERHLAFVVGASPRPELLTLDVADPRAPRIVERLALPSTGSPTAIALDATHLVVALQGGGVHHQARTAPLIPPPTPETVP